MDMNPRYKAVTAGDVEPSRDRSLIERFLSTDWLLIGVQVVLGGAGLLCFWRARFRMRQAADLEKLLQPQGAGWIRMSGVFMLLFGVGLLFITLMIVPRFYTDRTSLTFLILKFPFMD